MLLKYRAMCAPGGRLLMDFLSSLAAVWRHRRVIAGFGTFAQQGDVAVRAQVVCDWLRERSGRRFIWSRSSNHSLDASGHYVAIWELSPPGGRGVTSRFLYHGPVWALERMCAEGGSDMFDRWFDSEPPCREAA